MSDALTREEIEDLAREEAAMVIDGARATPREQNAFLIADADRYADYQDVRDYPLLAIRFPGARRAANVEQYPLWEQAFMRDLRLANVSIVNALGLTKDPMHAPLRAPDAEMVSVWAVDRHRFPDPIPVRIVDEADGGYVSRKDVHQVFGPQPPPKRSRWLPWRSSD